MSVKARFQVRWVMNTALISAFACSILLLILRQVLGRSLSNDYGTAYLALRELDSSLAFAIGITVLAYVLLTGSLVIFFKLNISHKIAGPLHRLDMCAASLGRGDLDFCTRLRRGDQLNGLAQTLGDLKARLRQPVEDAGSSLERMEKLLDGRDLEGFERELTSLAEMLRARTAGLPSA